MADQQTGSAQVYNCSIHYHKPKSEFIFQRKMVSDKGKEIATDRLDAIMAL